MNWRIRQAVNELNHGGLIAYPTEAVYGLGCDPWNVQAVKQLLALKQRSWQKGLIIIAADFNQLQDFVAPVSSDVLKQLESTWPGAVTWLLPVNSRCPLYLSGMHSTVAVRVTAHKKTVELCKSFGGAIVSTSANVAGNQPAKNIRQLRWNLPSIDIIVPGQCSGAKRTTEIRDAQTGERLR